MARTRFLLALCAAAPAAVACGTPNLLSESQHYRAASEPLDGADVSEQELALDVVREGASASGVVHPVGHDELCLDVVWGNNRDGQPVQVSKCNGNKAQEWTWSNGLLRAYGNKCLNVTEGSDEDGTRLQIWSCNDDTTDKNNLWRVENNTLRWQKNPARCLDIMNKRFASGTPLQLWSCGGSKGSENQRWTLPGAGAPSAAPDVANNAPAPQQPANGGKKSTTPHFELGVHIDYDNASGKSGGAGGYLSRTQVKPRLVANYVRCRRDGSFETGTAKHYADEAASIGAAVISYAITVEPTVLSQQQLNAIVESVRYAQGRGLAVELRFGYEMNGYWSPPLYDKQDPAVYKRAWAQLAPVARAAGAAMVWCPNVAGGAPDSYRHWLPDDLTSIDKVGIDYYLNASQGQKPTVAQARSIISGFYPVVQQVNDAHARANTGREVPFTFGETAVTIRDDRNNWGKSVASETELKRQWLTALSDAGLRQSFPLYRGFTWFDYYKTEKEGGTTGNVYNNAFEFSQDPGSAAMLRAWYQNLQR